MSRGLPVRLAKTRPCEGDSRDIFILVHRGRLQVNSDSVDHADLANRLAEIFKTRAYRYVFVAADPGVAFRDVTSVIDTALGEIDYVSLLTPAVFKPGVLSGICIDANLPQGYLQNPVKHRLGR